MKERIVPLAIAVAGALLAVGVLTFAGPCVHDDGTVSTCFGASRAVLGAGIVACVAGIAAALVRGIQGRLVLGAVGAIAGVFGAIAPGGLFALCMMQTMRCWTIMRPYSQILGVVVCVLGLVLVAGALARRSRAQRELRRMAR